MIYFCRITFINYEVNLICPLGRLKMDEHSEIQHICVGLKIVMKNTRECVLMKNTVRSVDMAPNKYPVSSSFDS